MIFLQLSSHRTTLDGNECAMSVSKARKSLGLFRKHNSVHPLHHHKCDTGTARSVARFISSTNQLQLSAMSHHRASLAELNAQAVEQLRTGSYAPATATLK